MSETVKIWLENLYDDAISEAKGTIRNEHMFEMGYEGEDGNPHTENISQLEEYIEVLKELKDNLWKEG